MSAVRASTNNRRHHSSSPTSSTTVWEGSGNATTLSRGGLMPPLTPPRENIPLVDSLRPLQPTISENNYYHNEDNATRALKFFFNPHWYTHFPID